MEKIKILHAIGNLSMGGAEFQCLLLANHLNPDVYELYILYFNEGSNPDVAGHVKVESVERGSYWDIVGICRRIDQAVDRIKPDVVQVWLPELISVPAAWSARKRGIPIVSGHRKTLKFAGSIKSFIRDRLRIPQYFIADRIVSNFGIDEEPLLFQRLFRKKHGSVIYNGLSFEKLRDRLPLQLENRAEHRLIYAGRLAPQKGLMLAFEALALLVAQGLDVHFTLFGEGPSSYIGKLKAKIAALELDDNITFFGECNHWQAYAGDATALLFPSQGEGTSNVVLEALAVGLPVVISNIAMSRELFRDRMDAIVVQTRNAPDWANELSILMKDPILREKLAANGKELSECFSLHSMVNAYTNLYQEMLTGLE